MQEVMTLENTMTYLIEIILDYNNKNTLCIVEIAYHQGSRLYGYKSSYTHRTSQKKKKLGRPYEYQTSK